MTEENKTRKRRKTTLQLRLIWEEDTVLLREATTYEDMAALQRAVRKGEVPAGNYEIVRQIAEVTVNHVQVTQTTIEGL